jgi:hypothetical protein
MMMISIYKVVGTIISIGNLPMLKGIQYKWYNDINYILHDKKDICILVKLLATNLLH